MKTVCVWISIFLLGLALYLDPSEPGLFRIYPWLVITGALWFIAYCAADDA